MTKSLIAVFTLGLLVNTALSAAGNYNFDTASARVFTDIYNLRFDRARDELYSAQDLSSEDVVPVYLKAHLPFVRFLVTGNPSDRHEFGQASEKAWEAIRSGNPNSAWHHYLTASLYLQEAILLYGDGQMAQAGVRLRKAYIAYGYALKIDKDFLPAKVEKNTLEILFGSVPDEYEWVISVLGIKPDINEAFSNLNRALSSLSSEEKYRPFSVPIIMTAGYMIRNFQDDADQQRDFILQTDKYLQANPKYASPLLRYLLAKFYQTLGENDMVLARLKDYKPEKGQIPLSYIYQLRGESRLRSLDKSSASDFKLFLKHYEGVDLRKETYRLLAWNAMISGDTSLARAYYRVLKAKGRAKFEADKIAQKEAESGILPNQSLLKVRLLFDGGYYERALQELLLHSPGSICRNRVEQVEYFYRLARIYEKTGKTTKALQFYDMVIDMGKDMEEYFAGNAALHAGSLCETVGNTARAKQYYERCLELPFEEYRKSIQQRAKAGIKRLS